jgi:four helix bundle protein
MNESIIKVKSFQLAVKSVYLAKDLKKKHREYTLSNQFLRSSTSVGANIRESRNAQSKPDFIHKLSISQKECDETIYWLELLLATGYLEKDEFDEVNSLALEILKMLKRSILTAKGNLK